MAKIDDLTSPDAWEAATQSYLDKHTAQVGTSIYSATGVDPDKAARAQAVGKTLGIPTQSVMAYPEDPERQLKVQQANPSNLVQTSPTLAQNLVNQNTANIIHDDLPNASGLEQGLRSAPTFQKWDAPDDTPGMRDRLSNWWRGVFGQPTVQEDRTAQRSAEANAIIASRRAGVAGDDAAWEASRKAIGGSSRIPDIAAEKFIDSATFGLVAPTDPTKSHSWQDSVAGGLGQLAGFLTGPVKGANALTGMTPLAALTEKVAGESFLKSLSKNVIEQAATLSIASGLEQAGHALLDTNNVGDAAKLEKDAVLGGAGTGAIFGAAGKVLPDSTILQGVLRGIGVNTAMGALHGDPMEAFDTVKDVLQGNNTPGLEERVFNVLLNSVFSLHGAGRTEGGWLHDATKMKVAEQDFQTLSTIGQLSATSKWRERDPEGFKNFVQSVTEDGKLDGVYIEGKSFAQGLEKAGITPDEVRNMMPDVASQMNEAIQTDGYVRIPTEDYLTHIAGGELDKEILQHLKTDPDGMTYADAQKFYEDHTESLKALALEGVKDQAQIDAFKQSQEEVQNHIQSQLDGLGRHSTDVNKVYASVQASVLTRIAAAEGITPEEAFVKYGANVTGTAIGNGFNQDKSLIAQHNLSSENLLHADRMGGLPVPSLAITKRENPIKGFGDITLLADKGLIDPKGGAKVFGSDIYSPRYPSVDVKLDKHALKAINEKLKDFSEGREIYSGAISSAEDLARVKAFEKYAEAQGVNKNEYHALKDLAEKTLRDVGAKEKIFKGYNNGGYRQYIDHTLDNVVKILKKDLRGGENFNYGVGSIRSKVSPQFKSIEQIRKSKDSLVSEESFDALKKEINSDFVKVAESLVDFHPASKGFGFLDSVSLTMQDAATMGLPKALKENGFNDVPEAQQKEIVEFMNKLRNLPTAYFEAKLLRSVELHEFKGAVVPDDVDAKVIKALSDKGITDIRTYKQGDEVDRAAKIGEFEHLFFQDNRGTYTPENRTIALLKDANLTTYLHETGHWALDMYSHIAENNPAIRGEMDKLLNWFGVDSLEKWNSMSIDEQRQYHEQFARGFEAYLMEGKAPSSELRPIFARIKTWMLDFYKSLSGLNVELTPEVRGVFDRMLASEEAIRQAEAARVFEPLFKDKPDSMTDADWANYITLGQEGTQEAIDAMQAKSLRDMKWSRGAKSKALKAAQKQADSLRREVRMEVTKEVMSQPLYRAWTFLTAKQGDKVAGKGDKAYKAGEINPNEDNIFTAISKLGGLKFEAVEHAWGVKDSERQKINEHGSKGKPVVHKTGGVEIDEMAEKLAREGYLTEDEHGKADVAELEAMFEDQRRGVDRYSFNRDMNEAYGDGWQALPDLPDMAYGKLSVKDIEYMFGDAKDAPWRKLEALKMTSKKDGLDPQIVAELFGLPSGKDLVKSLVETEHPKAIIEGLTDRRMLEQHGELATDRAIDDAASAAIHNDVRARFMATGLKVLAKSSVSARELLKGAREAADTAVGSKKVKDLNPRQYEVAESKANKQAIKDAAKDPATAVQAQRAALLNNQLVKSSQQAIADVRKGLDYQAKFDKPSVRENIDVAFRDQIDAIRAQYDFRRSMTPEAARENRLQSLESFVEKLSAMKFAVDVPEWMLDATNRTHYKDLTVDQFRGMIDAIKSIEHLGRSTQKVMDGAENRLLADVALEAEKQLEALPQRKVDGNRGLSMIAKKWVGAKSLGRSFAASLMKTEQMCDWLDNHDSNGVFNRLVFRKIADAEGKRNDLDLKISKMVESYVASVPKELIKNNRGAIEMPGVIDALTGETQKLTWGEKIALAGIRGDAGHFAKLLKGEKWSADAVLDFLDKNMAKEEWGFVKGLSETFEELAPLKAQMMRELGSTEPKLVDKIAFKTQHGDMPGWYWPISYDPARSHSVKERNAKHEASLFEDNIFAKADTSTGRENTRNENYAKPMLLSIDTLPRILKDEIRDITTRKAIIEADRFLTHPDVRKGVSSVLSPEHYDVFNGWLLSLANDAMVKPSELQMWDRLSHELRTRTTMVGLGFRISTMVQHGLTAAGESIAEAGPKAMAKGLFNSKTAAALSLIGPEWMQKGLDNFLRDTQFAQNRDFIFERSAEMRHRSNEIERDVRDKLREIQVALMDPATGSIERAKLAIESRAYSGIAMLDMASALPTWMGGYLKGLEKTEKGGLGMSEEDAVYFADKTVRNAHGGGGIKDLAQVQRGSEFFKLFTMFYTFWNHNINRIMDTGKRIKELPAEYRDAKESGDWAGFRGDVGTLVLRSFMYTLGVQAIHHMMHPPKEDDQNPEGWLMWFGKQMALSGLSGVPLARDVVGHYAGGKDYEMSPIASLIHNTDSLLKDMDSNSTSDRFIKHALTEAGYIFGLPLGQPASTVQFLSDVWTGNQNPQDISEWWRGVTTGNTRDR